MKNIVLFCLFVTIFLNSNRLYGQGSLKPLNPDFLSAIQSVNDSDKNADETGALPYPIQLGYSERQPSNPDFPAYFDLRTMGVLPPVKSQSSGGCWAYSTMSTVESRMLVLGQPLYNLSDNNLKYCHGFFDSRSTNGNAWMSTAYFARQSGPLLEAQDPYPGGTTLPNTDCPVGEAPAFFIRDSRYPPGDMATIKQLVMDVGSIWSLIYYTPAYFNDANDTYYYGGTHPVNHVFNVVGWDDNKVTAGGTGAWICQNTYGPTWGEAGFVYVSYNDSQFLIYNAYFPTFDYYNDDSRVLLYDELGNYGSYGWTGLETGYALVKYQLSENLFMEQIGTYAMAEATQIEVEIYRNFDAGTGQLSGLLSTVSTQTTGHPGYYTFDLNTQFPMNAGEVIYVKVKYTTPSYEWPVPVEYFIDTYADPAIESNVCWLSPSGASGDWTLIGATTAEPYDLCINVYGQYNPVTIPLNNISIIISVLAMLVFVLLKSKIRYF
jgi:C1A family cysteine protease